MKKHDFIKMLLNRGSLHSNTLFVVCFALIIFLVLYFLGGIFTELAEFLALLGFILLMPNFFVGLAIGWAIFHFFF